MNRFLYIPLILILISLITCQKEVIESQDYPRLNTLDATNISNEGATFNAEILSTGNKPIIEYGFLWDTIPDLHPFYSEKIEKKQTISKGKYDEKVNASLIEGKKYFVKGYIQTEDHIVLGQAVEFVSKGSLSSEIHSFSPSSAHWGDTILITGERFSYKSNEVKFGDLEANVAFNSDTLLKVIVPYKLNDPEVKLFIRTNDSYISSQEFFSYLQPEIKDFSPKSATFQDTISIEGKNFNKNNKFTEIKLGTKKIPPLLLTDSLIKFVVPNNLQKSSNELSVTSDDIVVHSKAPFNLEHFTIDDSKTDTISELSGDILITVNGTGFNPEISNNHITLAGYSAEITEATPTRLVFKFPLNWSLNLDYTFHWRYDVELQIADQEAQSSHIFLLANQGKWTWTKNESFPGGARFQPVSFVLNGKAYVGTGYGHSYPTSDFYEYDPEEDSWRQIASLPGGGRAGAVSCVVNGVAYVGLGTGKRKEDDNISSYLKKDWYKYEPVSDTWVQLNDFTGRPRSNSNSFSIDGEIYIIDGYMKYEDSETERVDYQGDLWKYNIETDSWVELPDPSVHFSRGQGLSVNNSGYVFSGNKISKYDGTEWTQREFSSFGNDYSVTYCNNKAYIVLPDNHSAGGTRSLYSMNLDDLSMEKIIFPGSNRSATTTFTIGNSIFTLFGRSFSSSDWDFYYFNDMYELKISE